MKVSPPLLPDEKQTKVSHYFWPDKDSVIEQIDVSKLQSGRMQAIIYVPTNADPRIGDVPRLLEEAGFEVLPDKGDAVLKITNFKKPEQVLGVLTKAGFLGGNRTSYVEGEEKSKTIREKLKVTGPKWASASGIGGHIGLILSGLYSGDKKMMSTGGFYAAANLFQAAFGNGKAGGELQQAAQEMRDLLEEKGINMPETVGFSDADMQKHNGLLSKMLDFCQSNAMAITNTLGLTGNILLTLADDNKKRDTKAPAADSNQLMNAWTKISGISSALAALTIIFVPEKAKVNPHKRIVQTPQEQNNEMGQGSIFKTVADKVQDNPLRVAGPLLLVSDAAMMARAGMKYAENQKTYEADTNPDKSWAKAHITSGFAGMTATGWVGSGLFTTLSSKEPPKDYDETEVQEHLVTTAAMVILKASPEVREKAIADVADYLVKRPDIIETREELIAHVNKRVEEVSRSPWQSKLATQKVQMMAMGPQNNAERV